MDDWQEDGSEDWAGEGGSHRSKDSKRKKDKKKLR